MDGIAEMREREMSAPIEVIIDEYGSGIWGMCYMYLKDKQLAEDAMQDTLIKVYQKYHTLQDEANVSMRLQRARMMLNSLIILRLKLKGFILKKKERGVLFFRHIKRNPQ